MMHSDVIGKERAYPALVAGMATLGRVARTMIGPCGRPALLEHVGKLTPMLAKDGRTLARALSDRHKALNVGLKLLVQASRAVDDRLADGSSTAIIVTQAMAEEVERALGAGLEATGICQGLREAAETVVAALIDLTLPANADDLRHIALSASNYDASIGDMVSEAFRRVGDGGNVRAEFGDGTEDSLEIVDGARFERGLLSQAFATNKDLGSLTLDAPLFLLTDQIIESFETLLPALEAAQMVGRPLVVIAEQVDGGVVAAMVMNHVRGKLRCAAIDAPLLGDSRSDAIEDLAIITGAKPFLQRLGGDLATLRLEDLGSCKRLKVEGGVTTIIEGSGIGDAKRARIDVLVRQRRNLKDETKSITGRVDLEEKLDERLAMLRECGAVVQIGGRSDFEIKYRLRAAEKAIGSTKSAQRSGIVPGGGYALLRATEAVRAEINSNETLGVRAGKRAVIQALTAPVTAIQINAGIQQRGRHNGSLWSGFDSVARADCDDLRAAGIIDPTELCQLVVQTAVSLCASICSVEGMIIQSSPVMGDFSPEIAAATREIN
ncbi:hypothetical protein C1T17_20800 (plasmid) [Sphingobium sp. SCG-1]|uniref:TCP-1/cpn60 chaperonin family protein n=1 Tax=Sphingobium sp. SCG-1 TaxID=2072936 RepID=UPI000CD6889A|nr:TCP-1/cpn60 chaperonin family protein [Sphingobium sp. SCG-1]AUW60479.1 hypothetical protein C1T17_19730 [Sphingobium sp. SCG-1]AUW60644.1 hypothetical protein C1T17_20800 [Sphingobium sp. SCG-1]